MERYSEYKDSGVKWLGEIPSHWEVMPIKYISEVSSGATPKTSVQGYWDGNITWVTPADFKTETKFVLKGNRNITTLGVKSCSTVILPKGSLVFSKRAPIGQVSILKIPLCTNQGCFGIIPNESMNNSFLYYSLAIHAQSFNTLGSGTTFRELSFSTFSSFKISVPPKEEQDAIVRYLDAATSKIDKAIAMQQKMIDLLNERKQIIIQNAVTKGLDENVEMKDSNCKFLGKIPSTWEVCKTLYVLSMPITDGPHTTPQLYDDGIPFVSAEAVSCGNGYIDFSHIRGYISDSFYNECCKKYIPQRDDIYMIKSGATTGKVAIVNTDVKFTIWSPLAVFRVNKKKVLPYFLYYSLQSSYYQLQVQDKWSFGTQQNIGMRMLEKLILCYPSIEEQAKIVAFIKKNVDNFDSAISNSQRQISLLQERKQIIINEVVTGKVKVS